MDGFTLLLLLVAFINVLTVIAMVNRLEARTDQRIARLERKINRIVAHINMPAHKSDDD